MTILKDPGHGVTRKSLDFWAANKSKIGPVLSIEVDDNLHSELSPEGYPLEYPCAIYGADGMIRLSGCTCGYGGEGPNGTAKILMDIGVEREAARRLMLQKPLSYHTGERRLL